MGYKTKNKDGFCPDIYILSELGHSRLQAKMDQERRCTSIFATWFLILRYRTQPHFWSWSPLVTSLLNIPQNGPWIKQKKSLDKNNSNNTYCSEFLVFFLCYRNNEEFTSLFIRKVRLEKDTPTWHRYWIRTIRISETKTKNCEEHINHIIQKRTIKKNLLHRNMNQKAAQQFTFL